MLRDIWGILSERERREACGVSFTIFANALLDFASIATLIPVLYYLLDGVENHKAALIFCIIALGVCGVKYLLSIRFARTQQRFLLGLYKRISISLYKSYYNRGLLFIRENGFSKLNYEINSLCYNFSEGVLAQLLHIISNAALLIILLTALAIYSPLCALVLVASFIPFAWVYLRVVHTKAKIYGEKVMRAQRRQGRIVNDTFAGYVELEVNDSFGAYSRHFMQGMEEIEEGKLKMVTVGILPSLLTELAVIMGLSIVATGLLGDVKLLLGIFVVAAFKLLPAVRSILSGWTRINNSAFSVEVISGGLKDGATCISPSETSACEVVSCDSLSREVVFDRSIQFCNVNYSYPDGTEVLRNICFEISKGEYVGLKGYSGVGKTTLFNLLLGFLKPTAGEILIDGKQLEESGRQGWLSKIGYVPQEVFIFRGNLVDNISMGDSEPDRGRMVRILRQLRLGEWLDALPNGLETDLCELGLRLSGGQRQRIGLARALYKKIEVLLLDEATSALDNETESEINQVIRELRMEESGLTIISIAHRESSLEYSDRVVELRT